KPAPRRRCAGSPMTASVDDEMCHRCGKTESAAAGELTLCYIVNMSVNVSVRLDDRLAERLRLRARAAGETLSAGLRRYAEEGARGDEHPLITFRDGPTGRRAGVIGGPDVWEIVMWVGGFGPMEGPAADLISGRAITRPQVDAALAYSVAYPEEIQA